MGKKKGLNLNLEVQCEIRDKNGRLIKTHRQVSKSLVKNFALALRGLMFGAANNKSVQLKGTGGVLQYYPWIAVASNPIHSVNAEVANTNYGIRVGSDETAVTRDDFKLYAPYEEGSGLGKMKHGAVTVEAVNGTPPDSQYRIIRTFTNEHTETQTVKEIGLIIYHIDAENSGNYYFLIARDVLVSPQDVPSMATLTVRYIPKVTA